jgi:hypothetical protein
MANNIERRNNTWFATLHIPKDVQDKFGKSKFFQTLKTTDKRVASDRAKLIVGDWKIQIEQARGSLNNLELEALQYKRVIAEAKSDEDKDTYSILASDRAEALGNHPLC